MKKCQKDIYIEREEDRVKKERKREKEKVSERE